MVTPHISSMSMGLAANKVAYCASGDWCLMMLVTEGQNKPDKAVETQCIMNGARLPHLPRVVSISPNSSNEVYVVLAKGSIPLFSLLRKQSLPRCIPYL